MKKYNCYTEEVPAIRESVLYSYFDVAFLSYEQGVKKHDVEIYKRCIQEFMLEADECLYVGDGGSYELEADRELGMNVVQVAWYLKEGTLQSAKI